MQLAKKFLEPPEIDSRKSIQEQPIQSSVTLESNCSSMSFVRRFKPI